MRFPLLPLAALLLMLPCCKGSDAGAESRSGSTSAAAARVVAPVAVARGRALFLAHCASCHGEHADGRGPRSRNLATHPADLTRLPPEHRRAPRLRDVLEHGVAGTDMPAWQALSADQLDDLVAYLQTLGPPETALAN